MKITTKYNIGDALYFVEAKTNTDPYYWSDVEWVVEDYAHPVKSITIDSDNKILYCVECKNETATVPLKTSVLKYVNEVNSFLTYEEAKTLTDTKNIDPSTKKIK